MVFIALVTVQGIIELRILDIFTPESFPVEYNQTQTKESSNVESLGYLVPG